MAFQPFSSFKGVNKVSGAALILQLRNIILKFRHVLWKQCFLFLVVAPFLKVELWLHIGALKFISLPQVALDTRLL